MSRHQSIGECKPTACQSLPHNQLNPNVFRLFENPGASAAHGHAVEDPELAAAIAASMAESVPAAAVAAPADASNAVTPAAAASGGAHDAAAATSGSIPPELQSVVGAAGEFMQSCHTATPLSLLCSAI
jgi:hypothetical protein